MKLQQRLSINPKTVQQKIVVRDDTGIKTHTNPNGYGVEPHTSIDLILKYIFQVVNNNTGSEVTHVFDASYPRVVDIAGHNDVDLAPNGSVFSDGVYTVKMASVYKTPFECVGLAGTNFIMNIPAFEVLSLYDSVVDVHNNIYKVIGLTAQGNILFLDRGLPYDVTEVWAAYGVTSEPFVLYQELEDCLMSHIIQELRDCSCENKINKDLNTLRNILWGVTISIKRGDYNYALKMLNKAKEICSHLNCGCNG